MANSKISALSTVASSTLATGDKIPFADVSDSTTKAIDPSDIVFKSVGGTITPNVVFAGTAVTTNLQVTTIKPTTGSNGTITVNAPTSSVPMLDMIAGTAAGLIIRASDVTTNNTNKLARFAYRHYSSSEEDVLLINATTDSGGNVVNYGGASGVFNSVTQHSFYAGATSTSLTGNEIFRINNNGINAYRSFTAGSALTVTGTATVDALRINQTPTSGAVTLTHYITVNLNGTTYRIPCGTG